MNKKIKLKSLIRFYSANKIDNHNESGMGKEKEILKERKKIQKKLQNKSNHKNNKCFSWVTAVRILSLAARHSLPHLPRRPSNTVLISGPAVGAAQILIWSCSCVFLPPVSTAVRTGAFSFVGALSVLLYILNTQGLPNWSCGFNLQLVHLVGRFGLFFRCTAPGF